MTYDQDRDARVQADITPADIREERDRTDVSVVMMLSIVALFIAFGFWFYATSGEHSVATDNRPAASQTTTGAGTREAPLPTTPTPPTVPSQPRQ